MIEVTPPKRLFSLMRRQVFTSVSVTSTVPSYFLFSCDDRSYTAQASFLINVIRMLAGAFNAEETCFLWTNFTPYLHMGPIPFTSPSGGFLGIDLIESLLFPLKSWNAEDKVVPSCASWHLGLRSVVLGTWPPRHGPCSQVERGSDRKLPGPTTIELLITIWRNYPISPWNLSCMRNWSLKFQVSTISPSSF